MEKNWCKRYARLRQERGDRVIKVIAKRNKNKHNRGDFYYEKNKPLVSCEAEKNSRAFVSGINRFFIRIAGSYYIFCDFFGLDPTDEKSEDKFRHFQQLAHTINKFSLEELAQMIGAGWRLLDDN